VANDIVLKASKRLETFVKLLSKNSTSGYEFALNATWITAMLMPASFTSACRAHTPDLTPQRIGKWDKINKNEYE
jgi:hypothetical protein